MTRSFEILKTQCEDLTALVRAAERGLHDGIVASLGTLETDVERFCAGIKSLPPQTAKEIQPHMAELISALDGLAEQLGDFKERHKDA